MSESFIELTGADGFPILINPRHVAFITRALLPPQNGNGPQVAVGMCAIMFADCGQAQVIQGHIVTAAPVVTVKASMEELYRLLRGDLSVVRDTGVSTLPVKAG